jgi:hypothetical protein
MNNTFELHIELKYQIIGFENLKFGNKMLVNTKTGRLKKQCHNGGMIGYWLDSKTFKSIKWIKSNLQEITKVDLPF